ncbi:Pentatricopeptide repeat [Dillenia turbinata]|uniref:Pentatricopeptide repeat n=1 Tax=Dillenia turbinata TaxID=194707 RepID=A0AAN8ZI34_9MAGN
MSAPARLLLIRVIDQKLPVLFGDSNKKHIEIVTAMLNLNVETEDAVRIQLFDMLVHVYCTQFKNAGLQLALDVFRLLADRGALVEDAIGLFSKMEELGVCPNVVTYNNLIHGLCKRGDVDNAFFYKQKMIQNGVDPSLVTYSVLINGLMKLNRLDQANCVLKEITDKGFVLNEIVYNTLIGGYCKIGDISEALKIKDEMMTAGITPNSVTFNSLIQGFCKIDQVEEGEQLLEEMLSRGLVVNAEMLLLNLKPGDALMTTLIAALCKECKCLEVVEIWSKLEKGFAPNIVTSNALIHGLCEADKMQDAVKLLKEMVNNGLALDRITYNTLILGCCKQGKVEEGVRLRDEMINQGMHPDIVTYNLLMHGLCIMGKMAEAENLWNELKEIGLVPDVVTHTIMIDGYSKTDKIEEKLRIGLNPCLIDEMRMEEGLVPDSFCYTALIGRHCKLGVDG